MDDRFDEQLRRRLGALDSAVPAEVSVGGVAGRVTRGAVTSGRGRGVRTAARLPLGLVAGLVVVVVGVAVLGTPPSTPGSGVGSEGSQVSQVSQASQVSYVPHTSIGGMVITRAMAVPVFGSGNPVIVTATITNRTGRSDKLLGGISPMAEKVGLYATSGGGTSPAAVNDVPSATNGQTPVPTDGLGNLVSMPWWLIGAGESIQLRAGDGEMVLDDLARPLVPGDTVVVTFEFATSPSVTVHIPVVSSMDSPVTATPQGSPWWYQSGISMCGTPALYLVAGTVGRAGSCAGNLVDPPDNVKVKVGDTVEVRLLAEADPSNSGKFLAFYATPTSSDPTVLVRRSVSDGGISSVFVAEAPGTARILTSGECDSAKAGAVLSQTFGQCPILQVTVTK